MGVSGGSIANASINQGRASTSTGSSAGTSPASSGNLQINMATYTFSPSIYTNPNILQLVAGSSSLGNDTGTVTLRLLSTSDTYDIRWRSFVP